jgi:hypothetical protein
MKHVKVQTINQAEFENSARMKPERVIPAEQMGH